MIACLSLYAENYEPLAEKTLFENRLQYCRKHGYASLFRKYDVHFDSSFKLACYLGFKKIEMILEAMEVVKDVPYVWFADCDAMIMNMGIQIEAITKEYPQDILIGSDCNGSSCGSMIIKNTDTAKTYLQTILNTRDAYLHEQDFIWKNLRDFVFAVPQRVMNSWDCTLPYLQPPPDQLEKAQFQSGDFLIHWPSQTLEKRLECYEKYKGQVIA